MFLKRILITATLASLLGLSALAQSVSLKLTGVTVKEAMEQLKDASGYSFVYKVGDIDTSRKVNLNASDLKQAIGQILNGQHVSYSINGKNIVISRGSTRQETAAVAQPEQGQPVHGTVTDENGEPLIGATVVLTGTGRATSTDLDGNWTLTARPGQTVEVSYVGYSPRKVKIGKDGDVNVALAEQSSMLDEVVVIGYGAQKKVNLTGAVATVNMEEQSKSRPMTTISQALSGAAAGLNVMQQGGQPNSENTKVLIRGIGTLNDASPLILVDGMEMSLNDVNPNDVASISILKDAASCAIYGNRGANGVILVTTKGGEEGRVSVTYSGKFAYQTAQKYHKQVNDYAEYMELMNEAAENSNQSPRFNPITIQKWRDAAADPNGTAESGYPNYVAYPNTDWYHEIYKPAWMQEHTVSVVGREKRTNFSLSGTYLHNPGIVDNSGLNKYYLRSSVETQIGEYITVGMKAWGFHADQDRNDIGILWGQDMQKTVPGVYPYYDGYYGGLETTEEEGTVHNPVKMLSLDWGSYKQSKYNVNPYLEVRFLKDFKFQSQFFYTDYQTHDKMITPAPVETKSFSRDMVLSTPPNAETMKNNTNSDTRNQMREWKFTNMLRYDRSFGIHDLSVMAGYEESRHWSDYVFAEKQGLSNFNLWDFDAMITPKKIGGNTSEYSSRSWFGRVNYAFDDRYLVEFNARYDGSSRFAPKTRWGFFPSVSAGWRISQEKFMQGIDWLSNLKLRASWGKLGNNSISNYEWQPNYSPYSYGFNGVQVMGYGLNTFANTDLRWEATTVTNIGLDFGVFNNRLSGAFEFYDKNTDGILYRPTLQPTLGDFIAPMQNLAEVNNKGVEITLNWNDRIGEVNYGVGANVSFNRNRVVKYKGELVNEWRTDADGNRYWYTNIGDVANVSGGNIIVDGHMINEYYMLSTYSGNGQGFNADGTVNIYGGPRDGMIRTEADMAWLRAMMAAGYEFMPGNSADKEHIWYGDYIYADVNGDGKYGDPNDREFQGTSSMPKCYFGLQAYLNWKGIDFSMSWAGATGFKIYYYAQSLNSTSMTAGYGIGREVASDHYFYDPENPTDLRTNIDSPNPRFVMNDTGQNSANASWKLQNGNYLKLKNVTVGYTLPAKWTNKVFMKQVRFYASLENLCTITKFKGLDPEMMAADGYAPMRTYSFGLNVTF